MPRVNKRELFASLPAPWPEDLLSRIRQTVSGQRGKLVVLDDDPTGTQTVHDVPVLTSWDVHSLSAEFENDLPCFYLLTNSRAFPAEEAVRISQEIGRNLRAAAIELPGRSNFVVVSRSDSTLRGHFPAEVDTLAAALGPRGPIDIRPDRDRLPPVLLVPYFEAGGRFTINDIHYVAEGDTLVPAAETAFAQDAVFGYRSSDLHAWVEEKTNGAIGASQVRSISLNDLRCGGPEVVKHKLLALPNGSVCFANIANPRDLEVLAWATLQVESLGGRVLYRTAASFVAARLGLAPHTLWQPPSDLPKTGGLTVVGSYVSKTTAQLEALLPQAGLVQHEISVEEILDTGTSTAVSRAVEEIEQSLRAGRDVVVFTSRKLVTGDFAEASLAVGSRVSDALVQIVQRLQSRPRYVIAKGGITSSDLATRGLGVKRALVLGQILPGVPVWKLGPETKFPGLPYVVFPGNVGGPEALNAAVSTFNPQNRCLDHESEKSHET